MTGSMAGSTALQRRVERMRVALAPVIALGPEFLAGRRDADDMAHTMVTAVQGYVAGEQGSPDAGGPADAETAPASQSPQSVALEAALAEVYTCGSGYLAERCDADCVARTMTQIVAEFGEPAG